MRITITCLAAVLASSLMAQPSLLSNEMAIAGTRVDYKYTEDYPDIDTTIQGAAVTWDFSLLTPAAGDLNITYMDPAQTPQGASFPTANYCWLEGPSTAYRYFTLTSTDMQRVGSWNGATLNTYSDPQTEYVYPLTLGAANSDTWANTQSSFDGTYSLECIGYGTLQLPGSTHTDALMVRVLVSEISWLTIYFWYDSDNGIVLLEYSAGDGGFIPAFALYFTDLSIGMKGLASFTARYNNPVSDQLFITLDSGDASPVSYTIIDMMGRTVGANQLATQAGYNQLTLDVSDLASGMYQVSLFKGLETASFKVMKE